MEPKKAIQEYISALQSVGADLTEYQFRVEAGRIMLGFVFGPEIDNVQWSMRSFTPEEFFEMAKKRRLDQKIGDPKKPY